MKKARTCFVLTRSAFAQHNKSDWFNVVPGDLEGPSHKPAVRPSSLSLDDQHTGCWCCPVCRLTRTRCPDALSGPTGTDPGSLKNNLPPMDADTHGINAEYFTEVSVLSEESYFTRDEEILVQSGSLRHFEVDFSRWTCPNHHQGKYLTLPVLLFILLNRCASISTEFSRKIGVV